MSVEFRNGAVEGEDAVGCTKSRAPALQQSLAEIFAAALSRKRSWKISFILSEYLEKERELNAQKSKEGGFVCEKALQFIFY